MISLTIKDTKTFMSHLLVKDTFNPLLLSEADIATGITTHINGTVNKEFYTSEELEQLPNTSYALWEAIKPTCFFLIKGNKVPTSMKIIFIFPEAMVTTFLADCGLEETPDAIQALCWNIHYTNGVATLISGTSLRTFTLDKTIEHTFDTYTRHKLAEFGIDFEE